MIPLRVMARDSEGELQPMQQQSSGMDFSPPKMQAGLHKLFESAACRNYSPFAFPSSTV